jgi:hypothetical protein
MVTTRSKQAYTLNSSNVTVRRGKRKKMKASDSMKKVRKRTCQLSKKHHFKNGNARCSKKKSRSCKYGSSELPRKKHKGFKCHKGKAY